MTLRIRMAFFALDIIRWVENRLDGMLDRWISGGKESLIDHGPSVFEGKSAWDQIDVGPPLIDQIQNQERIQNES